MKKFSRMPKSEGSGGGAAAGGAAGAGLGGGFASSSMGVRVFTVGRYQVTLEETLAEGTGDGRGGRQVREARGVAVAEGPARLLDEWLGLETAGGPGAGTVVCLSREFEIVFCSYWREGRNRRRPSK